MEETNRKSNVLLCLKFGDEIFNVGDCVCVHYFDDGLLKVINGRINDISPVNTYKDEPDYAIEIDTSEKYHSSDRLVYIDTIDSLEYLC